MTRKVIFTRLVHRTGSYMTNKLALETEVSLIMSFWENLENERTDSEMFIIPLWPRYVSNSTNLPYIYIPAPFPWYHSALSSPFCHLQKIVWFITYTSTVPSYLKTQADLRSTNVKEGLSASFLYSSFFSDTPSYQSLWGMRSTSSLLSRGLTCSFVFTPLQCQLCTQVTLQGLKGSIKKKTSSEEEPNLWPIYPLVLTAVLLSFTLLLSLTHEQRSRSTVVAWLGRSVGLPSLSQYTCTRGKLIYWRKYVTSDTIGGIMHSAC